MTTTSSRTSMPTLLGRKKCQRAKEIHISSNDWTIYHISHTARALEHSYSSMDTDTAKNAIPAVSQVFKNETKKTNMQKDCKTNNTGMLPKVELIWLATNLPAWPHSNKYAHSNNTRATTGSYRAADTGALIQGVSCQGQESVWGACRQKGKPTPPWKSSP